MSDPCSWPPSYLDTFKPFVDDPRSIPHMTALLNDHLNTTLLPRDGHTLDVLDVCCGTGIVGLAIERHLGTSTNCAITTTFLDQSQQVLDTISSNRKIQADVTGMNSVDSETFDIAICRYGFNNLAQENWLKALNEVLRVLRPGGLFLLQDHFVPGPTFSALINEAEQFLARLEGKTTIPFIFSTEMFNTILDEHPLVASRIKAGYSLRINIWERLKAKHEILPSFETAQAEIMRFYKEVCRDKFQLLIVEPEEYIHAYNITYAIVKR